MYWNWSLIDIFCLEDDLPTEKEIPGGNDQAQPQKQTRNSAVDEHPLSFCYRCNCTGF